MEPIKALVFDMDGTLLDTFPDLAKCADEVLAQMGFVAPPHDEMFGFMGRGGRWMIEQIVPADSTDEQRERTFQLWRERYIASDYALTRPYEGMTDALQKLRQRGVKTAVLSNKFHEGVCELAQRHFPGLFDAVRGDAPPIPRKPDPTSLLQMLDELGVTPDEAAYVGDAVVDVTTACNAGVRIIGVSWGYDQADPLPPGQLDACVHAPAELLGLCFE